jgi:hypothetical protein
MGDIRAKNVVVMFPRADGKKGTMTMAYGTYQFLFGSAGAGTDVKPYTTIDLGATTYQRRAYAGGPMITVNREAQTIKKAIYGPKGSSKSEKKLILDNGDTQDTIHYTGKVHEAVDFLIEKAKISGGKVSIKGPTGVTYTDIFAVAP